MGQMRAVANNLALYLLTTAAAPMNAIDPGAAMPTIAYLREDATIQIPPQLVEQQHWRSGQCLLLVSTPEGVVIEPVKEPRELFGLTRGCDTSGYRDREDRF